jgi:hypothetical protein
MRCVIRITAILGLVTSGVLALLGIVAWPPGGLMFALPYVLFSLAGLVGVPSAIVLLMTRAAGQGPPGT